MYSEVNFCELKLDHPIINASGTFDTIAALHVFGEDLLADFPFSAYVTKTVTCEPRAGNPPPRMWELGNGMINSIGLPNKGVKRFLSEDLPIYEHLPVPLIVNVMGFSEDEFQSLVHACADRTQIAAIELNVSCPNVKTGLEFGSGSTQIAALLQGVRPLTDKPLIVKLTPNCASPAAVAEAAQDYGADAVSLLNTLRGMAINPDDNVSPWLGGKTGGVSGPALRPLVLAQVSEIRQRIDIPIVGMGGVQTGRHAHELLAVGASLVAVGTESFRDPLAARRISNELFDWFEPGLPQPETVETKP